MIPLDILFIPILFPQSSLSGPTNVPGPFDPKSHFSPSPLPYILPVFITGRT